MDIVGKFQTQGLGAKLTREVRETALQRVYQRFYQYYRPRLKERYQQGSKTTPYAKTSLGKLKRSGERIRQVPNSKFGQDSLDLYNDVVRYPKITDEGITVRTNIVYAPYILGKFKDKGGLSPEGVIYMDEDDLDHLETILLEEYLNSTGG